MQKLYFSSFLSHKVRTDHTVRKLDSFLTKNNTPAVDDQTAENAEQMDTTTEDKENKQKQQLASSAKKSDMVLYGYYLYIHPILFDNQVNYVTLLAFGAILGSYPLIEHEVQRSYNSQKYANFQQAWILGHDPNSPNSLLALGTWPN